MKNHILKLLLRHNFVNFTGFAIVAAINISLISIVIGYYGIEKFGMLAIVRYLLPVGILGIFDFGIPESTTRYVAHSNGKSNEAKISAIAGLSLFMLGIIGITVASLFYIIIENVEFASLIRDSNPYIVGIVTLTIALMFPGIGLESIIKGLEGFILIRVMDAFRSIVYFCLVVYFISVGKDFVYVIYALLLSYFIHYVLYFTIFITIRSFPNLSLRNINRKLIVSFLSYSKIIFKGKIISNIMTNIPPFLIAPVSGVAAVGVYEALMRLPKYTKTVLSIVNASVMPVSARLRGEGNYKSEQQLLLTGTKISALLFLPPLICTMVLAESILVVWLGVSYQSYSLWFSFVFLLPFMTSYLTVGKSMLTVHKSVLILINRIAVMQLFIFLLIGLFLLQKMPETSFLIAIVLAQFVAAPFQIALISKFFVVSITELIRPLKWVILSAVVPFILFRMVYARLLDTAEILLVLILWCIVQWLIMFTFAFTKIQKKKLLSLFSNNKKGM